MSRPEYPSQKEIRRFMNRQFNDDELMAFCFDNFPDVWRNFATGQSKNDKLIRLIEFCTRISQIDDLLTYLHEDRMNVFPATWLSFVKNVSDTWINPVDGKEFVRVPAGEFLAGGEKVSVNIEEFWISKTTVTNEEYARFIAENPHVDVPYGDPRYAEKYSWNKEKRTYPVGQANYPVIQVTWEDAVQYTDWSKTQLPSKLQWEKAARGTDGRVYPWGDDTPTPEICNMIKYDKWEVQKFMNKYGHMPANILAIEHAPLPVGSFSPQSDSPYGCIDMAGNVWEWTQTYNEYNRSYLLCGGSYLSSAPSLTTFSSMTSWFIKSLEFGFRVIKILK